MEKKAKSLPKPAFKLSKVQFEEVERAFKQFDTDASGLLDRHELKIAFRALGFDVKKSQIDEYMQRYDPKGYGGIDKNAFHTIIDPLVYNRDPVSEAQRSYKGFDPEGRGRPIDLARLRQLCDQFHIVFTDQKLKQMIAEFDEDGDGCINEDEFIQIFNPIR
ncbi:EF hand family protein [Trichomonas vaginalis G3]|uniref:EF hand family protein n=1 Tax=Trichomonas vaginalis (strain ATCC PRA-98 / G3) TaxID=412133 RepID=A2F805_TRIV3|nr:calcium ion binding [Trichomonas vaginalis G3]EAX98937.1 EF hand family protein [Trichomonas vaginalis G3]KAI5533497.1 calcium ion binding [Trichomonas vaginalis G3]|eukprot:XP_001311867.1 EF hand family protein [Trichomonas vaginalis G3]